MINLIHVPIVARRVVVMRLIICVNCNAACKKKHRHKHKKECEEYVKAATEHAAKLYDEKLFEQPPPKEDCPICFIQLPCIASGWRYMACCGKVLCSGCIHAPVYDSQGNKVDNEKCAFCRTPTPTNMEKIEMNRKRAEAGDATAIYLLGNYYEEGINGLKQDYGKALELWHKSIKLGSAMAYTSIGYAYQKGMGVEVDERKVVHYYERGAMEGDSTTRYNLGLLSASEGNYDRSTKHFMIAARCGYSDSLNKIQRLYIKGHARKEDYTTALQLYQLYLGETKSDQRDKAAAANENYRYY